MKVVKISAIWCGGCLVMNKVWKKLKENFDYEFIELDYDMDEEEVQKYNPGEVLPVFIFFIDEKEVMRITGELTYDEMVKRIEEVGEKNE